MNERGLIRYRKLITVGAVVMLIAHVLVALSLTFFPRQTRLGKSKLSSAYQHFVHLGPFYRAESIQSTPHFIIAKGNDQLDLIRQYQEGYYGGFLNVDNLLASDYVRRTADALEKNEGNRLAVKKMRWVTHKHLADLHAGDTVSWYYYHRWYNLASQSWRNDTIFSIQFPLG